MSADHRGDHGADHGHGESASCGCAPAGVTAPLSITINPEARVNVARTQVPLPTFTVGEWVPVAIRVTNDGFVSGPLIGEAKPVAGVQLDLPAYALTGIDEDLAFGVRFEAPGIAEIELRFLALAALGGLADHSTVSLLMRCPETTAEVALSRA